MGWARTLRIDVVLDEQKRTGIAAALRQAGAEVRFGPQVLHSREYALVEAGDDVLPEDVAQCVQAGRLFGETIIVLAIEPTTPDALPVCLNALGGAGRPAGVLDCERIGSQLVLEFLPSTTSASLINAILDVELQRFSASRTAVLL
ncbi:MAG: hypothetical protein M3R35_05195, partial [Candidatus Eremiobacteraeota bacterium]|nr:hypothetical protein [Candidatus Eremiobacteraeota bacterium]